MTRLLSALAALILLVALAAGTPSAQAATLGCGGDLVGTLPNCTVAHIGANGRLADNWPLFLKYFGADSLANAGRVGNVGIMAAGSDTSINLVLAPKAGCLIMRVPDGSTTGGQPCGQGSVDLQSAVDQANKGVMAKYSFAYGYANSISVNSIYSFAGGYNCQITGTSPTSFCWGYNTTITGQGGITMGRNCNDHQRFNLFQWCPRSWTDIAEGKSQLGWGLWAYAYSDTTTHILTSDKAAYSVGLNGYKVAVGYAYTIRCTGLTTVSGSASGAAEMSTLPETMIDVPSSGTINFAGGAASTVAFSAVTPSTGAIVSLALAKDTTNMALTLTATASAAAARRTQARCELQELGKL